MLDRLAGYIVEPFITESLRARGPEIVRRARAVIWMTFAMSLISGLGLLEMAARGAYALMGLLAVMMVASCLCPFLLRRTGSVPLIGSIVLTGFFVGVIMMAWRAGGLGAPVLYTLALAPFLATLGVQRNASLIWGTVSVVVVIAFVLLNVTDSVPPTTVEPSALMRGHAMVLFVVIFITLAGVRIYERLREGELLRLEIAQKQAEEARKQAEAANRAKRDFLANISHEIRTPMTGVMTASAMLVSMPLDKNARELVEIIHKSADALLVVMDDMLDFARLEQGRVNLSPAPLDATLMASAVVQLMAPDAEAKGLALRVTLPEEHVPAVIGDEARLRQVLVNLVSNAIKFTDSGTVEVVLAIEPEGDRAHVRIEVIDTGIGMTEQDLRRVFERFERVEEEGGPQRRGTGLGLAISRQLAELMNGTLEATSRRGKGSRFTLRLSLPVAAPSMPQRSASIDVPLVNAKVLLAEDNSINRRICSMILERLGCETHLARNGRVALEMAIEEPYDVILMDCFMPEMDGLTATRKLRERGGVLTELPIIAFTAGGTEQDRLACFEAGMNDVITKPVRIQQLAETLQRWVGTRGSARDASEPPGRAAVGCTPGAAVRPKQP